MNDILAEVEARMKARIVELSNQRGLNRPVEQWSDADHAYHWALSNAQGALMVVVDDVKRVVRKAAA